MPVNLLRTKLHVPRVPAELVPRPRLIQRLEAGLTGRLTLVSAPAGFGKTTLVSAWVQGSGRPFAWLSLDEGDNDTTLFISYLTAALGQIHEAIGEGVAGFLTGPEPPPVEVPITSLINDLADLTETILFVLDDYHIIHSPSVHHAIEFLLDHQPETLHLVMITREDPPLPLSRLRVRAQVTEIRTDDLRFSAQEAAGFLNTRLGALQSEAIVTALQERTEGWVAGLHLAALSLQGRTDLSAFVESFRGSHHYVTEYLFDEVLQQQPPPIKSFLRQTAILHRLNASLCDAVTGRQDSTEVLHWLEHANLFLTPLDDEHEWYRYHQLFADFLNAGQKPDQQAVFHQRAARWLEENGYLREGIGHYLAAGQMEQAAALINRSSHDWLQTGEFTTLLGWLEALPDELVEADSLLSTMKAWCLLLTGQYDQGVAIVQRLDEQLAPDKYPPDTHPPDADRISLGRLRLLQAYLARPEVGPLSVYVPEAVELLGEEDALFSLVAMVMLANNQTISNPSAAIRTFERVIEIARRQRYSLVEVAALTDLIAVLDMQGRRRDALAFAEEHIARHLDAQGVPLRSTGLILIHAGMLAYAADELTSAEQAVRQGLAYCRQLALRTAVPAGLRSLATIQFARGEHQAALQTIDEAHRLALSVHDELLETFCITTKAEILLSHGRVTEAARLLEALESLPWPPTHPYYATANLAWVRLLLVQNHIQEAQSYLKILSRWAEDMGHAGYLITILILKAHAAIAHRDTSSARKWLAQAVEIAAPQDYRRHFLNENTSILDLLPDVRHAAPVFVDALLAAIHKARPAQALLDPLTDREHEVLRLIADGLTNPDIAERLSITVSTTKKHINRIFSKLEAHDRTQAVLRARELHLL